MNAAEKAKAWASEASALGLQDLADAHTRFAAREAESIGGESRFETENKETK